MKIRLAVLALVCLLPTCADQSLKNEPPPPVERTRSALGTNPPSEIATWTRVAGGDVPDPRVGQAVAYDSSRKLIMMFGGTAALPGDIQTTRQDIWEWNVTTNKWRERTPTGTKPESRSEAAVVYDTVRDRFVMFGGRAGSNLNLEDTWEWNPADGTWTDKTGAGAKPDARARHAMVWDGKRKVAVLFGGGRSIQGLAASTATDRAEMVSAFASTWEYDPVTAIWTDRTPAAAAASPSARYDAGMTWDSQRNLVVLFGGMQKKEAAGLASPKQDIWDWNGETGTWIERTLAGSKPSVRFGHGMAYDPGRNRVVVFGGYDVASGQTKNDLWDWEPGTGLWTERPVASTKLPSARIWASLVLLSESSPAHMMLLAGSIKADNMGGPSASSDPTDTRLLNDVWDLDPAVGTWSDLPIEISGPGPRFGQAMATDLETGKVYMFGGDDALSSPMNDLWVWDGKDWTMCSSLATSPSKRTNAGMAYDPIRKSLIVFGGADNLSHDSPGGMPPALADTWEWNLAKATWTQLKPTGSPPGRSGLVLVTDVKRGRIIMAGGQDYGRQSPPNAAGPPQTPSLTDAWEWDGATLTWTNVSPPVGWPGPTMLAPPYATWDTDRSKLVAIENYVGPQYYEWDPYSHGWAARALMDGVGPITGATFDSARRRLLIMGYDRRVNGQVSMLELDTASGIWYSRPAPSALQQRFQEGLAYDNKRGVVVLHGGTGNGSVRGDTWEYKVTGWGDGVGCSTDFASRCASGNCVEGVCCESAACAGSCKSCRVPAFMGTCASAAPGAPVAGSCSGQNACDSAGACKAANASACTSAVECASGFCVDGVCCESACQDTCTACNLAGRVGLCSPYLAGTDPEKECSKGTPPCTSSCNGAGACAFANYTTTCGQCGRCDGYGACIENYYSFCTNVGGATGSGGSGGTGGLYGTGGSAGTAGTGSLGGTGGGTGGVGGIFTVGGTGGNGSLAGTGGRATSGGTGGRGGTSTGGQIRGGTTTGGTATAGTSGSGGTAGPGGSGGLASLGGTAGTGTGGTTSTGGMAGSSGAGTTTSGSTPDGGVPPGDGGPLTDGGGLIRTDARMGDGGGPDARPAKLGKSGCGCRLGGAPSPEGTSVLLLVGLAWLTRRARKPRR